MHRNFLLVLLVGIAFMLIFTAFNTAAQANESIMEGARNESGGSFNASGYISLGLLYLFCAIFNWISPVVVHLTSPKLGMFIGSLSYVAFLASFFRPATWIIYATSCLLGIGAAILWTSHGVYMTLCSKPTEMSRNFGIFWMLFQSSGVIGSLYTYLHLSDVVSITSEVRVPMYAALTTICAAGCLILVSLPSIFAEPLEDANILVESQGDARNSSSSSSIPSLEPSRGSKSLPPPNMSVIHIISRSLALFQTKSMIFILLSTAFTGINLTFFSGVFGTCLSRMERFGSAAKSYIGLSGIFIGVGEILGSQISLLGNKIGSGAIMCFGFASALIGQFMAFLVIPANAPIQITTDVAYIAPSVYVAMSSALLLGITDSLWNVQISALIGKIYPSSSGNTAAAFALFKFVQSVSSAVAFFYSSVLLLHWQVLILATSSTIGVFAFLIVDGRSLCSKPPVLATAVD